MKTLKRNIRIISFAFIIMFVILIAYFAYSVAKFGGRWLTNPYNPRLTSQRSLVVPGDILDRNRIVLAGADSNGNRTYNKSKNLRMAVSHIVGDNYGLTIGAESTYANYLLGFNSGVLERVIDSFSSRQRRGNSVMLTIDGKLSEFVAQAMGNYKGSVIIMNYKTGEILSAVSRPGFDPQNMDAYRPASDSEKRKEKKDGDSTVLFNRSTMGRYVPGSVFKMITMISAIKNIPDILEKEFDCEGPLAFDAANGQYLPGAEESPEVNLLRDYQDEYHGKINAKTAFAKSCNNAFSKIGMELGAEAIAKTAKEFGIGEEFFFEDITVYNSSYEKAANQHDLAWSAIGQYKDLVTPMQMALITNCIANDGSMMEPKLLKATLNTRDYITTALKRKEIKRPLTAEEARLMQELMFETVKSGTGRGAAIGKLELGGKTGTAEMSDNKDIKPHAWFVGFIKDEEHPLSVTVILENGGSGGSNAAPVAKKVLQKALDMGY